MAARKGEKKEKKRMKEERNEMLYEHTSRLKGVDAHQKKI